VESVAASIRPGLLARFARLACLAAALGAPLACATQSPPSDAPAADDPDVERAEPGSTPEATAEPTPSVELEELELGPGDEIDVQVYGHDDLTRHIRVPPDRVIFYPLVGEIDLRGVGVRALRRRLAEDLARFVVDPQVSVEVATIRSRNVYVLGEVETPIGFPLDEPIHVAEAISRAGGFSKDASRSRVAVLRKGAGPDELERLDVDSFFDSGDPSGNVALRPGDVVYVPSSFVSDVDRYFNVLYNVVRPIFFIESGIALYPAVRDAITGEDGDQGRGDRTQTVIIDTGND
jgi:polysaccharide export outer membrane protein